MNSSVGQGLTADVSQDALELHIEAMTDAGVESVEYRNNNTEAIVKLDKPTKFGSERCRTMCGKVVIIASMSTTPEVPVSVLLNECTAPETVRGSGVTRRSADRAAADDAYVTPRVRVSGVTRRPADRAAEDHAYVTPRVRVSGVTRMPADRAAADDAYVAPRVRGSGVTQRPADRAAADDAYVTPRVRGSGVTQRPADRAAADDAYVTPRVGGSGVTRRPAARAAADDAYVTSRASESVDKEKTETFTETRKYPADKRDLLKMLLPDLQSSLPNCSMKIVAEGIELHGSDEAVKKAKLEISEQVFCFKNCTIPLDRLLQSDKTQQHTQELFSKAGIQAVLSVRDDQLLLTAADDDQKSQASRILERNIHRSDIPVDDFHQEFLQSAQWKQFIDDLERNHTVTVEKGTSSVVIKALGDCSEDVLKQVRDKLKANAQQSDDIHLTEEEWELLKTHHQTEVEGFGRRKTG